MKYQTPNGGQAFPGFDWIDQAGRKNPAGMTLRDYFAGQALAGFLSAPMGKFPHQDRSDVVTKDSYDIADAMIAAREGKFA